MWSYYVTNTNVFWDNSSIDKPSKDYLNSIQWKLESLNVDMTNISTVDFYTQNKDITMLKIENSETNETLYYRFKRILRFVKNHYHVQFELDYWLTYSLKITDNDVSVLCDRHQDYVDDKKLEFDDNDYDLSFNKYEIVNKKFIDNTSSDGNYKIYGNDLINGVYCFVFNDSPNNNFMFIPLLSTSTRPIVECKIDTTQEIHITTPYEFSGIVRDSYTIYSSDGDINFGNQLMDFNRRGYKINGELRVFNKQTNTSISLVDYGSFNGKEVLFYTTSFWVIKKKNDRQIEIEWWKTENDKDILFFRTYASIPNGYSWTNCYLDFTVIKGEKPYKYPVDNNMGGLLELIKSKKWGNKFEGVFIIPNILNLTSTWYFERLDVRNDPSLIKPALSMLSLRINEQGVSLPKIDLLDDFKIDRNYKFNSEIPLDEIIYKKFDFYWYDNKIDISKLITNNNVSLTGTINFTNSFNFKFNNKLINIDNSLITFPNKQPFRFDEYINYIKNNMNTVNTGYAIQKQQAILKGVQGGFSSILGGVIGSSISGNPLGFLTGLGSLASNTASSILGLKNYEKQVQAKYADLDNQLGNKIIFGATNDTKWADYINKDFNYETFVIKKLSKDSIIRLNNDFLLNGVYNPKYLKLNDLPNSTKHLGFKYVKLNTININQIMSKYINEPLEIKEIILSQLSEFRIWDRIPSIE